MGDFIWLLVNLIVFQEKVDSLKCKICTVTNHLRNSAGSTFLIEWVTPYHWFIYRKPCQVNHSLPYHRSFSGASSFCRCSASPRRPTCRPQRLPQFTDPRLPTGRQYAGGSGHDPLQGSTRRWHCAYWHWLLLRYARGKGRKEERPSLGCGFFQHHPSSLHLQHSFKPGNCAPTFTASPPGGILS